MRIGENISSLGRWFCGAKRQRIGRIAGVTILAIFTSFMLPLFCSAPSAVAYPGFIWPLPGDASGRAAWTPDAEYGSKSLYLASSESVTVGESVNSHVAAAHADDIELAQAPMSRPKVPQAPPGFPWLQGNPRQQQIIRDNYERGREQQFKTPPSPQGDTPQSPPASPPPYAIVNCLQADLQTLDGNKLVIVLKAQSGHVTATPDGHFSGVPPGLSNSKLVLEQVNALKPRQAVVIRASTLNEKDPQYRVAFDKAKMQILKALDEDKSPPSVRKNNGN